MRFFPVLGGARYTNDWHEPRSDGRKHLGTDLFNDIGTPLIAVEDGEARYGTDPLGGNIINLRTSTGDRYYYAHLSRFEGSNRQVKAGEVIGYLGKTGNAATTAPHVHVEVHPGGGDAVNPFPILQKATVLAATPVGPPVSPPQPQPPLSSKVASTASGKWALGVMAVGAYLAWRYTKVR